jgi:integrase
MRTLETRCLCFGLHPMVPITCSFNPKTKKPYTDLKKAFGTACRIAGIRDLHWHDLRHTFGTRLAEAGCSEATIASPMGTLIRKQRADTHMPQTAQNERL